MVKINKKIIVTASEMQELKKWHNQKNKIELRKCWKGWVSYDVASLQAYTKYKFEKWLSCSFLSSWNLWVTAQWNQWDYTEDMNGLLTKNKWRNTERAVLRQQAVCCTEEHGALWDMIGNDRAKCKCLIDFFDQGRNNTSFYWSIAAGRG